MVEAAVERDAGQDGKQDRRQDGDDAEQADDAHMELGARYLPAPGEPQPGHLPGDDHHHRQHEHEVDKEHPHHHKVRRHDGGEAGQDDVGGKARAQRDHHGDQAEREGQTAARACGVALGAGRRDPVGTSRIARRLDHGFVRVPRRLGFGRFAQGLEDATQPHSPPSLDLAGP